MKSAFKKKKKMDSKIPESPSDLGKKVFFVCCLIGVAVLIYVYRDWIKAKFDELVNGLSKNSKSPQKCNAEGVEGVCTNGAIKDEQEQCTSSTCQPSDFGDETTNCCKKIESNNNDAIENNENKTEEIEHKENTKNTNDMKEKKNDLKTEIGAPIYASSPNTSTAPKVWKKAGEIQNLIVFMHKAGDVSIEGSKLINFVSGFANINEKKTPKEWAKYMTSFIKLEIQSKQYLLEKYAIDGQSETWLTFKVSPNPFSDFLEGKLEKVDVVKGNTFPKVGIYSALSVDEEWGGGSEETLGKCPKSNSNWVTIGEYKIDTSVYYDGIISLKKRDFIAPIANFLKVSADSKTSSEWVDYLSCNIKLESSQIDYSLVKPTNHNSDKSWIYMTAFPNPYNAIREKLNHNHSVYFYIKTTLQGPKQKEKEEQPPKYYDLDICGPYYKSNVNPDTTTINHNWECGKTCDSGINAVDNNCNCVCVRPQ